MRDASTRTGLPAVVGAMLPTAALPELVERLARQRLLDRPAVAEGPHLSTIG